MRRICQSSGVLSYDEWKPESHTASEEFAIIRLIIVMVWKIMATLITLGQTLIECFVCFNVLNVLNISVFELSPFLQMDNRISLWKKSYEERVCQFHSQANVFPVFSVA